MSISISAMALYSTRFQAWNLEYTDAWRNLFVFFGIDVGPLIGCTVQIFHPDRLSRSLVFAGMGLVLISNIIKSRFECLRRV